MYVARKFGIAVIYKTDNKCMT